MAKRFVQPYQTTFDDFGVIAPGAKLNFYITGTTTRLDTYTTEALSTANANPVVADSAGLLPAIWLKDEDYKVVATTSADVEIWTADPYDFNIVYTINLFDFIAPAQVAFIQAGDTGSQTAATVTSGIQDAIDYGVALGRNFTIKAPQGEYVINNELDFTSVVGGVAFVGDGFRHTRLLVTNFGRTKKLFKFGNPNTSTRTSENNYFAHFEVSTLTGVANADDPIVFYLPYSTGDTFNHVRTRVTGNTILWTSDCNNCRFMDIWAFGCGFHYTANDTASVSGLDAFSITNATTTLTCSVAVFDSGMVGDKIYIGEAGEFDGPLYTTIASFTSTTEVEVTDAARNTVSNGNVSWDGIRGSITAVGTTLTADTAIFSSSDVGRYIYVVGAATNGGVLVTTVASFTSTTVVELTDAAVTTATSQYIFFTPNVFIGTTQADRPSTTRATNDAILSMVHVEGYQGVAYLFSFGLNVWLSQCKSHGIGANFTKFARSVYNYIFDEMRHIQFSDGEMDYGNCGGDSGNILISGGESGVNISGFQYAACVENQYFIDYATNNGDSILKINGGSINKNPANEPGLITYSAQTSDVNVHQGLPITVRDNDDQTWLLPTQNSGTSTRRLISLADDTIMTVKPPNTAGIIEIWSDGATTAGSVYFRVTGSPAATVIAGLADLVAGTGALTDGTGDGVDVKFNVHAANDGLIYIKNRMGVTRFVGFQILA